ncbi:MAG: efflux RND transporter permease subunit [Deltaproteobacteria bacterium]|nr:efflux RND transporter permease subunit [Deltaproteobacteria bacterium]
MRVQVLAATLLLACRQPPTDPGPRAAAADTTVAAAPAPSWIAVRVAAAGDAPDDLDNAATVIEAAIAGHAAQHLWTTVTPHAVTCWLAIDVDDPMVPALELRQTMGEIAARLPPGLEPPMVESHPRDEELQWLHVEGASRSAAQLSSIAAQVRTRVETVTGVREVRRCGPVQRTVIEIDPVRTAAFGIAPQRVAELLGTAGGSAFGAAAIEPAQLFERAGLGEAQAAAIATIRIETETTCEVPGGGIGLRLRLSGEHGDALAPVLTSLAAQLPAGVGLRLADAPAVPREALAVLADDPAVRERVTPVLAQWASRQLGAPVEVMTTPAIETLVVTPDRERAARLGVAVGELAQAVQLASSRGRVVGRRDDAEGTEVAVRIGDGGPDALVGVTVPGADGHAIALTEVATISTTRVAPRMRCDRQACALLVAEVGLAGLDLEAAARAGARGRCVDRADAVAAVRGLIAGLTAPRPCLPRSAPTRSSRSACRGAAARARASRCRRG